MCLPFHDTSKLRGFSSQKWFSLNVFYAYAGSVTHKGNTLWRSCDCWTSFRYGLFSVQHRFSPCSTDSSIRLIYSGKDVGVLFHILLKYFVSWNSLNTAYLFLLVGNNTGGIELWNVTSAKKLFTRQFMVWEVKTISAMFLVYPFFSIILSLLVTSKLSDIVISTTLHSGGYGE